MTDPSRGVRARRGGRRPGWVLLTALLVLAIGASSALVFTNRVELLKLAVILALWAAVVAAFVSVIYRRQSDVDAARARDLKLVYDLQLDREISARREYELTVESQLRRELASELRAYAADEVSELRAELAALRTNLEILFDAELSERPALEGERTAVRGYSEWDRENESARERVNRVASVRAEEPARRVDDTSIIDVPEEPLTPPQQRRSSTENQQQGYARPSDDAYAISGQSRATEAPDPERGSHWARSDQENHAVRSEPAPTSGWNPPQPPPASVPERPQEGRGWAQPEQRRSQPGGWAMPGPSPKTEPERFEPDATRRPHRLPDTSPPERQPATPTAEPPPQQQRSGWPSPTEAPRQSEQSGWQPVSPEGQWLPPGAPGSRWTSGQTETNAPSSWAYDNGPARDNNAAPRAPGIAEPAAEPPPERRGRHSSSAAESAPGQPAEPGADWSQSSRRARSRHAAESADPGAVESSTPAPAMSPPPPAPPPPPQPTPDRGPVMSPPPSARHRSADDPAESHEPQSGGQSVAELLARLQTTPGEGGRRRRREE
jgi:hypothetical protein